MKFSFWQKIWLVNLILAVLFIFDRVFKQLPHSFQNPYIAFGIPLAGRWLALAIAVILLILIVALVQAYKKKRIGQISAFTLLIFGAASNLIDRVCFGFVIDYIGLGPLSNFNLADLMIVGGAILLSLHLLFPCKVRK